MIAEAELKSVHAEISRLKGEIKDRQAALTIAEGKLKPLLALIEVYQSKRIEAPRETNTRDDPSFPQPAPERGLLDVTPRPEPTPPVSDLGRAITTALAKPPPIAPVKSSPPKPADDDSKPDEPIEADYNQIARWCAARNLDWKSWEDLPSVNRRREKYELAPFKRKLGERARA